MAEFTPGKPVRSSEPSVRVDTLLASGRYRFRLVVLDNDRNASAPAELIVSIVKDAGAAPPTTPTTPVTPVTPIISVTPVTPIIPTTLVMPTVPVTPSLSVAPKDEPTRKRRAPRRAKAAPARKRRTPRRPKS